VATSNAIALNPYSQSRGAQTAANFNNAINSEYDRQTAKITRQFQLAREALAAGHAEAAYKLRKSAQDSLAEANQQFKQGLMSLYQQAKEQQRFDIQQQSKYQDDFIERLSLLGENASPEDFNSLF